MNIQIRLSESGVKHQVTIPFNSKVKDIQEIIWRDYRIQTNDQMLITKNGNILHPDGDLTILGADKEKTYAPENQNIHQLKRLACVHVFSRKTLKSQECVKSPRDQQLYEQLRIKCKQMACLNLKSQFKSLQQTKTRDELRKLQQLNPEINIHINNILKSDERLLSELNQYQQLKSFVTQQNQQVTTQISSIIVLFKSLSQYGKNVFMRHCKVQDHVAFFKKIRQDSYKSLQQLKKIPIQQKDYLQKDLRAKNLFQLMFNQQSIEGLYTKTQKVVQQITRKLIDQHDVLDSNINGKKIIDSRNFFTTKIKKKEHEAISTRIQTFRQKLDQIKFSRQSNYRIIYDNINRWLNNENDYEAQQYLLSIKKNPESISFSNNSYLNELIFENEYLRKSYTELSKHKLKSETFFKKAYDQYQDFENQFIKIQNELILMDKELNLITKQIENSWNMKQCKENYELGLAQTEKRLIFLKRINSLYKQGLLLNQQEEQRRKKYISMRKKSKVYDCFPQLMQYAATKLVLNQGADAKLPKYDLLSKHHIPDTNDIMLKQIQELTTNINNYKKSKQNQQPNRLQAKLQNLEDILIKTNKICHQIYNYKLKQELGKYEQTLQSMNEIKMQHESMIKKLKEQLKYKDKSEIESQRQLKKNKSDLDQYNRRKEEYRSQPSDLAKLRDQILRKQDLNKNLAFQNKSLHQNIKTLNQEKVNLISQSNRSRQQLHKIASKLQETQRSYRSIKNEKQKLQIFMQTLKNQIKQQISSSEKNEVILDLQQKMQNMCTNLQQQASELQHERMMSMQLQMVVKNKQVQIINLQKKVQELQIALQSTNIKQFEEQKDQFGDQNDVNYEVNRLRQQNIRLQQELEDVCQQLKLIIQKQTFQIQTQTQSDSTVSLQQISVGKTLIFIPVSTGIYTPLVMIDSSKTQLQFSNTYVSSYKTNYFLNIQSFPLNIKALVNECSLIVLARATSIIETYAKYDNAYGIKEGDSYFMIEVDKPQYIVGFDDEDLNLKNYANI